MKIHIVQRNDTFQSIAEKYNVSVQDLIGMNTHINHLAGLVPGLKVKVPSPVRKEESNVAQHIQKYYPNLDTNPVELKTITTVEPEPVVVKQQEQVKKVQPVPVQVKEEAIPIPLKPMQSEVPTKPNDEVKVGGTIASVEQYNVSVSQKTYEQPKQTASTSAKAQTVASSTSTPQVPPYPL
ncbi:MAG: LysM peptidoglycan-binding domain-containing protein, partial [Turicibacter sp.]|nr:LysM peptidoglycan-binding domain-containing protein [Turicibacter sp.]